MKQRVFTAIFAAISVTALYIPPDTSDENLSEVIKDAQLILNPSNHKVGSRSSINAKLPSKFDLRNVDGMNFISSVKDQGLWGTCWLFSSIGAIEASAQYELWKSHGISPKELPLDFSELQLGWFAYSAIQKNETSYPAQKGEGIYLDKNVAPLSLGGNRDLVVSLLASGIGPTDEKDAPYRSKSGKTLWIKLDKNGKPVFDKNGSLVTEIHPLNWKAPANFKPYNLVTKGEDWSVSLKNKFKSKLRLEHAYDLPCPATYNEKNRYVFDKFGLTAIKQELNHGRAVDISFHADDTDFNSLKNTPKYISKNYAHYTYDEHTSANHGVTIVGYDDNYSVSNFLQKDKNGKKIAPPGNGAFICKNSWGSKKDKFYRNSEWGINGTGYFYLSYYDKSLSEPTSYDFSLVQIVQNKKGVVRTIDQHDLMPAKIGWDVFLSTYDTATSNVFTPKRNEALESISLRVFIPNLTVEYSIYKLKSNYANPTDGTMVASGSKNIKYAGFHIIGLKTPIQISSTESYSIVIKQKDKEGNSYYGFSKSITKKFHDAYNAAVTNKNDKLTYYSVGVVNKGESFINKGGRWYDETSVISSYTKAEYPHPSKPNTNLVVENGVTFDNFPIKGYVVINKK
eukprot:jgi/Orpsp1_1/1184673/evm.model.c7180000090503.1